MSPLRCGEDNIGPVVLDDESIVTTKPGDIVFIVERRGGDTGSDVVLGGLVGQERALLVLILFETEFADENDEDIEVI